MGVASNVGKGFWKSVTEALDIGASRYTKSGSFTRGVTSMLDAAAVNHPGMVGAGIIGTAAGGYFGSMYAGRVAFGDNWSPTRGRNGERDIVGVPFW